MKLNHLAKIDYIVSTIFIVMMIPFWVPAYVLQLLKKPFTWVLAYGEVLHHRLCNWLARQADEVKDGRISVQKAAKIMAVLMILGNNEAMVMNRHFTADCEYIQKRFHINGGEVPDATFSQYLKEYVSDLQEADRQGFIPQWAEKLFMEDYEIKLYR